VGKVSEIRYIAKEYDLIGITESWTNDGINDAEISIDDFNIFRKDRKGYKGGGLLLYVRNNLQACCNDRLSNSEFEESLWCNIQLKNRCLLVGLCYRSPVSKVSNDEKLLSLLDMAVLQERPQHLLIMGDFNYPEIDYVGEAVAGGDKSSAAHFLHKTQDLCLFQHVTEATRYRNSQVPSTLDYVFTEDEDLIDRISYAAPLGKSDHIVLEWVMVLEAREVKCAFEKLDYFKGDYATITANLEQVNWVQQLENETANDMWGKLKRLLMEQVQLHVPVKNVTRKKQGQWLSKETIKRMKERGKAWKKYQKFKSGKNYEEYKKIRNEVNCMIRDDENRHRKGILQGFKGKPKKFYGYMRSLQTVKENVVSLTKDDGVLTTNDQETADLLADYFHDVYTREDMQNMPQATTRNDSEVNFDDSDIIFTPSVVMAKLVKLQGDKAPGPDNIHPQLLKECATVLAKPLSMIYQKSFDTGSLPSDWKSANIVPIFKKGKKSDRSNYRPVSLTSVPCKVMEGIIKENLLSFLQDNKMINNDQHGFMRGRSCLTNLLETLESWTRALDEGFGLDVIYLDYKKAFDSVPIKRLLIKLRQYGIGGKLILWIEDFLTARTMRVGLRGAFSSLLEVLSGVPQGSVLGPLLFLLFVNELPMWIVNDMKMFADDTKVWTKIKSATDGASLQSDLNQLTDWSNIWQLKFNPDKCKVMSIGHKQDTKYYMNDGTGLRELEAMHEERDLGVFVSADLKPSTQCIKAAAKARRIVGMVRRNFRRLDSKDFLLIYKTYIRPHLEYCVQAWSPHLIKDIEVLERVQKAATNLVPELRKFEYNMRLQKLGITSLKIRRDRGDMIETYKILTGKEQIDSEQFFQLDKNVHGLRGHSWKIVKERSRLDIRKYSFSQRVVNGWNRLPASVVVAKTVNGFKNAYDSYLQDMDDRS